jgi:hypothetical protein
VAGENQLRDQGRQIEPGRPAAGESPVNQDRATIGYQHVVSAKVAVHERRAAGIGHPVTLYPGQCLQMRRGPRMQVRRRSSGHLSPPVMPWRDPRRGLRQAAGRHVDCSERIENGWQVTAQRAEIGVTSASIIEGEHDPPGDLVVPAQHRSRDARRDPRRRVGLVPV